jgi:uncharacterized glyoxalase superfamily protein PhnB
MRMVFMAYLTGSIEAVDFYCRAFNTNSRYCFKHSDDDNFMPMQRFISMIK